MRGSAGAPASSPSANSALAVPAAPAPSLTAPAAPPPPSLASAPAGAPTESALHADDAYCALCRRCQMRKRLERRLAARRVPGTGPEPTAAGGAAHAGSPDHLSEMGDDGGPPQRDERSITELLDYIGERAATQSARGGRRARRKRAAAMRRRALACADGTDTGDGSSGSGSGSRKGRISRDGAVTVSARSERLGASIGNGDAACCASRDAHGSQASNSPHVSHRSNISHGSHGSHDEEDDDEDGEGEGNGNSDVGAFSEQFVLYANGQVTSMEQRDREYMDPMDREVEEFRRLLEAAHANPGARTLVHGATR